MGRAAAMSSFRGGDHGRGEVMARWKEVFVRLTPILAHYRETVAYLVFGALTVVVNLAAYRWSLLAMSDMPANTVAFFIAVFFAYLTNCLFVFRQKLSWKSLGQFLGARIGALLIDDGGMWLLLSLGCDRTLGKLVVNAVIIALNYVLSKFFIFNDRRE
jgi:putative flippase GtrA